VAFAKYYMANIWKGTGKPKMALHLLQGTVGQGTLDGAQQWRIPWESTWLTPRTMPSVLLGNREPDPH